MTINFYQIIFSSMAKFVSPSRQKDHSSSPEDEPLDCNEPPTKITFFAPTIDKSPCCLFMHTYSATNSHCKTLFFQHVLIYMFNLPVSPAGILQFEGNQLNDNCKISYKTGKTLCHSEQVERKHSVLSEFLNQSEFPKHWIQSALH